jgi:hypothetical protein
VLKLEQIVRWANHRPVAWGFYMVTRLGDMLTTAYQLHRGGNDPSIEASPIPRLFMDWYGAGAGNLVHEAFTLGGVVAIYVMFRPVQQRYRGWLDWARRRGVPLVSHLRPEILSVIDRLSPNIIPISVGIASACVFGHNLLVIWLD